MSKLKEEIGAMEREHSELQQHITRTDWWCENLGHWRAAITAAEVIITAGWNRSEQSNVILALYGLVQFYVAEQPSPFSIMQLLLKSVILS